MPIFQLPTRKIIFKGLLLLMLVILLLRIIPVHLSKDPCCTVIESQDASLLGAKIASDGQWRFPPSDSIPVKVKSALLLFEDQYFYYHPGCNLVSLGRAILQNIKAGKIVSGGSTITMQLARLELKAKNRSLWNKFKEILLSLRLESYYSKNSILNLYISKAPFGGNVVGITTASWRYFGKDPSMLSWAESATLAVLPNSPSLINPAKNRNALKTKRNRLLSRLQKQGIIDYSTYQMAVSEPLPDKPLPLPQSAPHLLEKAYKDYPEERVVTTINPELQQRIHSILELHQKQLKENEIHNIAALVLNVKTNSVVAYLGNISDDEVQSGVDVDIIQSSRSTGSLLKPVLYAAMLYSGEILPNTLVADLPTQIGDFAPKNYFMTYDGAVPAKRALEKSLNVPAVKMLQNYGVERFRQLLITLGMSTLNYSAEHYGLTLILGGAEGKLWDMCSMYASLARVVNQYVPMESAYDKSDICYPAYVKKESDKFKKRKHIKTDQAIIGAGAAWLMFDALVDVNRPDQESAWRSFLGSGKVAWKTGTSFGYRDGWAIGTTPDYVVGVWVGNADGEGRPGLTGIGTAAPVLFDILDLLPANNWFTIPFDDLEKTAVCRQSGHLASSNCEQIDSIFIPVQGNLSLPCPYHKMVHLTKDLKYRVNSNCEDVANMVHLNWFILPPAQEYYFKLKNPFYQILPPLKPGCKDGSNLQMIDLVTLRDINKVFIPREMDGTLGKIIFQAAHRNPKATIFWHLDEVFIGQTRNQHQISIQPSKGMHKLVLVDDEGNRFVKTFEVISRQNN